MDKSTFYAWLLSLSDSRVFISKGKMKIAYSRTGGSVIKNYWSASCKYFSHGRLINATYRTVTLAGEKPSWSNGVVVDDGPDGPNSPEHFESFSQIHYVGK